MLEFLSLEDIALLQSQKKLLCFYDFQIESHHLFFEKSLFQSMLYLFQSGLKCESAQSYGKISFMVKSNKS